MKTKEITEEQKRLVLKRIDEARKECKNLYDENHKDFMAPLQKVIIELHNYLKDNVEASALYSYSQQAMYGRKLLFNFDEEANLAKLIYNDIYDKEQPVPILGDL